MRCHLAEELIAQHDFIFKPAGQKSLVWIARIPDPRFAHEIKTRLMRNHRFLMLPVSAEKYCGAKYTLKGGNESPILRAALLHSEDVQHFGGAAKRNRLFLLAHGKRSEEDRNKAVLSPWNSVVRMPGDLQQELAIAPLVQENTFCGSFDRQPA